MSEAIILRVANAAGEPVDVFSNPSNSTETTVIDSTTKHTRHWTCDTIPFRKLEQRTLPNGDVVYVLPGTDEVCLNVGTAYSTTTTEASTTSTVEYTPTRPELAETGADTLPLVGIAAGLIAVGGLCLRVRNQLQSLQQPN